MNRNWQCNFLLSLGSTLLILIISELLLQIFGVGTYSKQERVLFFSQPSFVEEDLGALRYEKNIYLREVAIFGGIVEYDKTYKSNNMGFIDTLDYPYEINGKQGLTEVILGDSFTAGAGASESWVSQLRELKSRQHVAERLFYNLGVTGTGILHFERLITSVSRDLEFDVINVAAISGDFFRPFWRPASDHLGVRLCKPEVSLENCLQNKDTPMAPRIELDESQAALVVRASEIYRQRRQLPKDQLSWYTGLSLYTLVCDALYSLTRDPDLIGKCPHLRLYKRKKRCKDATFASSVAALQRLVSAFPDKRFRFLHIPEKSEVYWGSYGLDPSDDVTSAGFEYFPLLELCDWNIAMFYKNDGHPNDYGYTTLSRCIADKVFTGKESH